MANRKNKPAKPKPAKRRQAERITRVSPEKLKELKDAQHDQEHHKAQTSAAAARYQIAIVSVLRDAGLALEAGSVCLQCGDVFRRDTEHTC